MAKKNPPKTADRAESRPAPAPAARPTPAPAPRPAAAPAPAPRAAAPTPKPAVPKPPAKPAAAAAAAPAPKLTAAQNAQRQSNITAVQDAIRAGDKNTAQLLLGGVQNVGKQDARGALQAAINAIPAKTPVVTGTDNGTGTGDGDGDTGAFEDALALQQQQQAWEERMAEMARQREQRQVIQTVQALFAQYGLGSLNSVIEQYARMDYSPDAIGILLRETPEYKARFPAMASLIAKKRAITEADYIDYERKSAGLERQYGLPTGMLMGSVTNLLENEVSMTELNDRVVLASAAAIQAPEELKTTFRDFYGIDTGGLAAYFLDPKIAAPLLEKQFASTLIGTEARRQGVGLDVYGAENLQQLGITQEQARTGFQQVARAQPLTEGRGDVVSQKELIQGTFGASEEARQATERAAGARVGRFQGGGAFVSTQQGVTGLQESTTR